MDRIGLILDYISTRYKKILFALFILTLLTYFLRGILSLDPDFGWRYRVGRLILSEGIPKKDPFSYTMPSFPFVDHAWFFSFLVGLTYPIFGNFLLSLVLTLAVVGSVYLQGKILDWQEIEHTKDFQKPFLKIFFHPINLLLIAFLLVFFSVRAQIISWFGFSLLSLVLFKKLCYRKYKFFIPAIFFVWANLHGGYFIGLVILGFFLINQVFFSKNLGFFDLLIFPSSVLATLLNPYGIGSWREVYSSISDPTLRYSIAEWLPSITFFDASMAFYMAVSLFMVYSQRHKISKFYFYLYILLFVFALTSRRNLPFWMLFASPLTVKSLEKFYRENLHIKKFKERFSKAYFYFVLIVCLFLVFQIYSSFWKQALSSFLPQGGEKKGFYPVNAVEYLKTHNPSGQIFSNYGWGGYLIWKLPDKKVFIDGRMPSWRNPNAPPAESKYAFGDYVKIETGELNFDEVRLKYGVDTVLWPQKSETFLDNLESKLKKIPFIKKKWKEFDFLEYLKNSGWELVYSDETAVIFSKPLAGRI